MDHFIPRGKEKLFPEYATHYTNLIPLCHSCNHTKGDDWIEKGRQIFFNAYFDSLKDIEILMCEIIINASTRIPTSKIRLNISGKESDVCWRIVKTINRLDLLPQYSRESNKILRSKSIELKTEYELQNDRYIDKDDFISAKRGVIGAMISKADDFLSKLTFTAIAGSNNYWHFIKSQL